MRDTPIIEPGIKPLCDALNALPGTKTVWSCEGHPSKFGGIYVPYVVFKTDEDTARKIDKEIANRHHGLQFLWMLSGYFDPHGQWHYKIESNDIAILRHGFIKKTGWIARWNAREMYEEVRLMAKIVSEVS